MPNSNQNKNERPDHLWRAHSRQVKKTYPFGPYFFYQNTHLFATCIVRSWRSQTWAFGVPGSCDSGIRWYPLPIWHGSVSRTSCGTCIITIFVTIGAVFCIYTGSIFCNVRCISLGLRRPPFFLIQLFVQVVANSRLSSLCFANLIEV